MLGGDPSIPVDSSLIEGWMQADWETLYPGEPNRLVRQQLLAHLRAMLALNPGTHQIIALNGELVKATQAALLRMSLAERALALLKSTSRSGEVKDWSLAVAAGPDAAAIFETADGAPIDAVRVPSIFTYDGFYKQFLERMQAVIDLLNKERWLLGDGAQKGTVDRQLTQLGPDLLQLYDQEFLTAWSTALNRIKMKSLTTGSPDFPALQIAGGETSPIKAVIESIAAETRLTEPRQAQAAEIDTKAAQDALKVVGGRLGNMAAIGLEAATKATGRGGEVQPALAPGARIQERFRRYHELTSSKGDKTQIDILIENLKGLHQSLVEEQNFEQAAQARQNTLKFLGALNSNASRLEAPFNDLVKTALTEFEAKIVGERVANLKGRMAEQVTRKCLDVIGSRYPFTAKSKRDVPLAEFSRLFGPNGVFDQFFNENLTGLVDTSGKSWEWKKNTKLGQELSAATLQQFQNAARIRDAFFTGQGSAPNVRFALAMVSLSQQAPSATFEVNGVKLESPFGVESRGDFEWPGNSPDGTASVSLPEVAGSSSSLSFTGPWALHRLLNEGSIRQSGNRTIVRFVIGGREVSYQLTFDTLDNPFLLIPQLKFSCPTEL
jgi:type VI secretion system protein ImpL